MQSVTVRNWRGGKAPRSVAAAFEQGVSFTQSEIRNNGRVPPPNFPVKKREIQMFFF